MPLLVTPTAPAVEQYEPACTTPTLGAGSDVSDADVSAGTAVATSIVGAAGATAVAATGGGVASATLADARTRGAAEVEGTGSVDAGAGGIAMADEVAAVVIGADDVAATATSGAGEGSVGGLPAVPAMPIRVRTAAARYPPTRTPRERCVPAKAARATGSNTSHQRICVPGCHVRERRCSLASLEDRGGRQLAVSATGAFGGYQVTVLSPVGARGRLSAVEHANQLGHYVLNHR